MVKKKTFEDPLVDIDPVLESVFTPRSDAEEQRITRVLEEQRQSIADVEFPTLSSDVAGKKLELDTFSKIPVSVSVELGRAQISLKEVFELTEGSIIELERLVGEPLDLVVNGQVVAKGEVVAIDSSYGLRVTQVLAVPAR